MADKDDNLSRKYVVTRGQPYPQQYGWHKQAPRAVHKLLFISLSLATLLNAPLSSP